MWEEWVIDVSLDGIPPCFVPYERDTNTLVLGMTIMADHCPGLLVGVAHDGGQVEVEKWCAENPDWQTRFSRDMKEQ